MKLMPLMSVVMQGIILAGDPGARLHPIINIFVLLRNANLAAEKNN